MSGTRSSYKLSCLPLTRRFSHPLLLCRLSSSPILVTSGGHSLLVLGPMWQPAAQEGGGAVPRPKSYTGGVTRKMWTISGCFPHWDFSKDFSGGSCPKAGRANRFPSSQLQLQSVTSGVPECRSEKLHVAQLGSARNGTRWTSDVLG